jgi:hypothetical protein
VSFGADGTAYYLTLAFNPDRRSGAFGANGLLVSPSTDGGVSWGDPITIVEDGPGQILNDNEYNPVACSVLKATLEYPFRFGTKLAERARRWVGFGRSGSLKGSAAFSRKSGTQSLQGKRQTVCLDQSQGPSAPR